MTQLEYGNFRNETITNLSAGKNLTGRQKIEEFRSFVKANVSGILDNNKNLSMSDFKFLEKNSQIKSINVKGLDTLNKSIFHLSDIHMNKGKRITRDGKYIIRSESFNNLNRAYEGKINGNYDAKELLNIAKNLFDELEQKYNIKTPVEFYIGENDNGENIYYSKVDNINGLDLSKKEDLSEINKYIQETYINISKYYLDKLKNGGFFLTDINNGSQYVYGKTMKEINKEKQIYLVDTDIYLDNRKESLMTVIYWLTIHLSRIEKKLNAKNAIARDNIREFINLYQNIFPKMESKNIQRLFEVKKYLIGEEFGDEILPAIPTFEDTPDQNGNSDTKNIYNSTAESYDEDPETQAFFSLEKGTVLEMLSLLKGEKVLDLGCGTGKYINVFPDDVEIYGSDISEEMINQSKKKNINKQVKYEVSDITKGLPFPDSYFDKINCSHVLKFITSQEELEYAFKEIKRVLKKGGTFVFTNNHPERNFEWSDYELKNNNVESNENNEDVSIPMKLHSMEDYKKACKHAGLEIEGILDVTINKNLEDLLTRDSFEKVSGKKIIIAMKIRNGLESESQKLFNNSQDILAEIETIFGKKPIVISKLSGGLTNNVYLIKLEGGEKIVLKQGDDLTKESDFYSSIPENGNSKFPKLLAKIGENILIFEYKKGLNGKEVVNEINPDNWEAIGEEFGKSLKELHELDIQVNQEEKEEGIEKMIDYLRVNAKYIEQSKYDYELNSLKKLINKSKNNFVMLHGDFSPHNCLFEKYENSNYSISAILDPSARTGNGINYFDIVYLFNTRWNKNKSKLIEGFLKEYNFDLEDPLFKQFDKVMKMYLSEIYSAMGDKDSSENLINELEAKSRFDQETAFKELESGKYHTNKEIIVEGFEILRKLNTDSLDRFDLMDLKLVLFGIMPSRQIGSEKLMKFIISNEVVLKNKIILVDKFVNIFDEIFKELININASIKVINANPDLFPEQAQLDTEKWIRNDPKKIFPNGINDEIGNKRYGLLSGFPRYSVGLYFKWQNLRDKYNKEFEFIQENIFNNNSLNIEEKKIELSKILNGTYSYIEHDFKDLLLNFNLENLSAAIFSETDAEYMRNVKLFEKYFIL